MKIYLEKTKKSLPNFTNFMNFTNFQLHRVVLPDINIPGYIVCLLLLIFSSLAYSNNPAETTGKQSYTFINSSNVFKWNAEESQNRINVSVVVPENYYLSRDLTSVNIVDSTGKKLIPVSKPAFTKLVGILNAKEYIYPTGKWTWEFDKTYNVPFTVNVRYQGCSRNPMQCLPPQVYTEKLEGKNQVSAAGKTVAASGKTNDKITGQSVSIVPKKNIAVPGFISSMVDRGGIWIFLLAFLGGLMSVFTPCVLPLLPITLAVLGAGKDSSAGQAVKRSFLYVLGMIITFTVLAVIAALTGKAFGSVIFSNPVILIIFALFFCIMSFSLLGLYDFRLPTSWSLKLNNVGGGTNTGALLMGFVAGFIAIPCLGPVLATLLGIAAASTNVFFGSTLLLVFATGFGLPFFLVGIGLVKTPKSGAYMEVIKSLLGVIILLLALYVLCIALPSVGNFFIIPSFLHKILAICFVIVGVLSGAFHGDGHSVKKIVKYLKVIGAILVSAGVLWLIKIPVGQVPEPLHWNTDVQKAFILAEKNNQPIIMDFYADWCIPCRELDVKTFSDKTVSDELKKNWIIVKVDGTENTPYFMKIQKKYNVKGFPTVIFFSSHGKELYRFSGFTGPDEFNILLDKYKTSY